MRVWARALVCMGVVAGSGCASVVGSSESDVAIRTNPPAAQCHLKGHGGYSATVATPATLTIPTAAAPVTVTCSAPGFRPTANTLDASAEGWVWGNSAFMVASGGVALLGLVVDESLGAGRAYSSDVHYDLAPDVPRAVRARSRGGDVDLRLQAR